MATQLDFRGSPPASGAEVGRLPYGRRGLAYGWIGASAREAERLGVEVSTELARHRMTDRIDADTLLDPAAFLLMCAIVINGVDDEMHGVSRHRMARGTAAMACQAMTSHRTLEDAVHFIARFFRMVGSFCALELEQSGAVATLKIRSESAEGILGNVVEEMMAHFLHLQFSFLVQSMLPLTAFVSRSPAHPAMGNVHPYLMCPVVEGRVTAMQFPRAALAQPCLARTEDLPLWDAQRFWLTHHPLLRTASPAWVHSAGPAGRVFQLLHDGVDSIECCSLAMSVGVGELRRQLSDEGLTFRQIRRDALIARARPHLEAGMSADDIADMLGYSDSRSFRRALKLAGGGTIQALRLMPEGENPVLDQRMLERLRELALSQQ